MLRITSISTMFRIALMPCLLIQYARYCTCSAKNLDFEIFSLISAVESHARDISNLSRWYLKIIFVIYCYQKVIDI
jgi:hypothetical protein